MSTQRLQYRRDSLSDSENDDDAFKPNPYQAVADAQVRSGAWPGTPLLMSRPASPHSQPRLSTQQSTVVEGRPLTQQSQRGLTQGTSDNQLGLDNWIPTYSVEGQRLAQQAYEGATFFASSAPASQEGSRCASPKPGRFQSYQSGSNMVPLTGSSFGMVMQADLAPGSNPCSAPGSRCASPSVSSRFDSNNHIMGIPVMASGHIPGNASPCFVSSPHCASSSSWNPPVCFPVVMMASTSPVGQQPVAPASHGTREGYGSSERRDVSPVEGRRRRRLGHNLTAELRDSVSQVVHTVNPSPPMRAQPGSGRASPRRKDDGTSPPKLDSPGSTKRVVHLKPEFAKMGKLANSLPLGRINSRASQWEQAVNGDSDNPKNDVNEAAKPLPQTIEPPTPKLALGPESSRSRSQSESTPKHADATTGDASAAWSFLPEFCILNKTGMESSRKATSSSDEFHTEKQCKDQEEDIPDMPPSAVPDPEHVASLGGVCPEPLMVSPSVIPDDMFRTRTMTADDPSILLSMDFESLQAPAVAKKLSHSSVPKSTDLTRKFGCSREDAQITTLMIRNIPNTYTRAMLSAELDNLGFAGHYNFLYLPIDKSTSWNVGYSFVNFLDANIAYCFRQVTVNYKFCQASHQGVHKPMLVSVAHIQGLKNNMKHYSNTAVQCARVHNQRPLVLVGRDKPPRRSRRNRSGRGREQPRQDPYEE